MATQHVERNLLNLYREENISLVCFFLPLKRDKNVWHLQPPFSTWRPLAFLPVTLSFGGGGLWGSGFIQVEGMQRRPVGVEVGGGGYITSSWRCVGHSVLFVTL